MHPPRAHPRRHPLLALLFLLVEPAPGVSPGSPHCPAATANPRPGRL